MKTNSKKVFVVGKDAFGWATSESRKNTINLLKKIDELILLNNEKARIRTRLIHYFLLFPLLKRFCDHYDPLMLDADVIYCVYYELLLKNTMNKRIFYYFLSLLKKIKGIRIVAVITNDIRYTPEKINVGKKLVDVWIAPNSKIHSYLKNLGLKVELISFLIDKAIFKKINRPKLDLCKSLGITIKDVEKLYLIGSFQRDSSRADLSKPRWEKNPGLLIEIVRRLPKDKYMLVLAGPRRHYIINECKKFHIPYLFVGDETCIIKNKDDIIANNLSLEIINLLYNLSDLCIVTSRSEGGPKAILEAALTKTLIFSTDAGLAADNLHPSLIYKENELDYVISMIRTSIKNPDQFQDRITYNYNNAIDSLDENKLMRKIRAVIYEY